VVRLFSFHHRCAYHLPAFTIPPPAITRLPHCRHSYGRLCLYAHMYANVGYLARAKHLHTTTFTPAPALEHHTHTHRTPHRFTHACRTTHYTLRCTAPARTGYRCSALGATYLPLVSTPFNPCTFPPFSATCDTDLVGFTDVTFSLPTTGFGWFVLRVKQFNRFPRDDFKLLWTTTW